MAQNQISDYVFNPAQGVSGVPAQTITDWQAYTPIVQGMVFSVQEFMWRRVGENIEISGNFTASSTNGSEFQLWLPNGYSVSGKISVSPRVVGFFSRSVSSPWRKEWNLLATAWDTYLNYSPCSDSETNDPLLPQVGNLWLAWGEKVSLFALVPIQGLTSTSTLSIATDPVQTTWQAYTPTVQGMTFGASYFMWRKNWENCEIMGKFTVSTTSASEFRLWLPNSITVSSKISRPTSVVWYILRGISSSWARKNWSLLATSWNSYLNHSASWDPQTDDPLVAQLWNLWFNPSDEWSFYASLPIQGWDTNAGLVSYQNLNVDYSTAETDTGAKWIDGKAIYRKVISGWALANGVNNIAHGITWLDTCISVKSLSDNGTNQFIINWYQTTTTDYILINDTNVRVNITTGTMPNSTIIIEYTKV